MTVEIESRLIPISASSLGVRPDGEDVAFVFASVVSFGLVLAGGVYAVGYLLPNPALRLWLRSMEFAQQDILVLLVLFAEVVILGGSIVFAVRWRRLAWSDMGLRAAPSRRWYVISIAMSVIVVPILLLLIDLALAPFDLQHQDLDFLLHAVDGKPVSQAALIFLTCAAVPLVEEILFRGILYTWLRQRWGIAVAVTLSSTAFGLAHGAPDIFIPLAVLGALIAMLYELSGSLWPAVLAHAINNGLAFVAIYLSS